VARTLARRVEQRLTAEFRVLWRAASVSNLGDGLRVAALPLLAATITRDPMQIAAVTAMIWLPWLVTGLYAGALVDRVDRPQLIRNVQLGRLTVEGALAVLVVIDEASMPIIYLAAFLIGAGEVLVDNALQSLVPRVVARGDLERANSALIAAETAGNELVGPPVGALLFAVVPAAPFVVDAASYGYSASVAHRLSRHIPPERRPRVPLRRITREVVDGLRWLRGHSYLRAITLWGGVFNIGSTAAFSLLVLFALEVLDTGDVGYGLLLSVVAIGGLAGTAVASPLARRVGRGRTILLGAVGSGMVVSVVGLIDDKYAAAALLFAGSGLGAMVNVVGRALRQAMVPDLMLGRVTGSNRVIVYGAMPLGAILGGWIARTLDLRAAFVVGGLIMTAVSLAIAPCLREHLIDDALRVNPG
jgi:MFS family permease